MRPSNVVAAALLLATVILGWVLVFSDPSAAPRARPAPEPAEAPVELEPAQPEPPAAQPQPAPLPQERVARNVAPPDDDPIEPQVVDEEPVDEEPPDPEVALELPPHLENAGPDQQRRYFEELKHHHETLLAQARRDLEKLSEQDTDTRAHLLQMIEAGQAQLDLIVEHLGTL